MDPSVYEGQVQQAADFIKQRNSHHISVAIILGTGLAGFENLLEHSTTIRYTDIPNFPASTAPSHKGELTIGFIGDTAVMCFSGRLHYYEGYSMKEITFPIRLIGELGVYQLIITNASGGTNESFDAGDLVFIKDHINLFPDNPLRGQNHNKWGDRFPDMSRAYDVSGLKKAQQACEELNIEFKTGVYTGFPGPNLETPAEYEYIHRIGGDMVGMSTVPEVLVARHMNIKVIGISLVTNACYPPERIKETTVEEVIAMAEEKGELFIALVMKLIQF